MFNGLKNMFGGGLDLSAMIGPMLPGIIKDAAPKLVQAFDQKALDLENELDEPLVNEDERAEEIVAFISKRGGNLQLDWVRLSHFYLGDDEWSVEISETLETITMEAFFESVMANTGKADAPVMQLPEPLSAPELPKQLHAISEQVRKAPIDPSRFEEIPEVQQNHQHYFNHRYVVVGTEGAFRVLEGPAPEGVTVWYGHQDETIARNWAHTKNLELRGK